MSNESDLDNHSSIEANGLEESDLALQLRPLEIIPKWLRVSGKIKKGEKRPRYLINFHLFPYEEVGAFFAKKLSSNNKFESWQDWNSSILTRSLPDHTVGAQISSKQLFDATKRFASLIVATLLGGDRRQPYFDTENLKRFCTVAALEPPNASLCYNDFYEDLKELASAQGGNDILLKNFKEEDYSVSN